MVTDKQVAEFWQALTPAQRNQLMRDVLKSVEVDKTRHANRRYLTEDGIIDFVREKLGAKKIYPYQERILRALVRYKRVAVRSPHGAGKTVVAAWFILWLMECHDDVKAATLAPTDRQNGFIWSEVRRWARRLDNRDFDILQRRLQGIGKEAFSVSSDDSSLIEGLHAETVGYVFDESKTIPDTFFDSAEGAFANIGNELGFQGYWLAISTPAQPSGMFYDIHSRKAGLTDWNCLHIKIEECIQSGAISRQWVEQRRVQWGENSAVYRNRVLAEFDDSGEDSVIPLSWVEKAHERYYQLLPTQSATDESYGCDPARYGPDKTAIAHRVGRVIRKVSYHSKEDTMQSAGRVASLLSIAPQNTPCAVDTIGVGAGVYDRLKELGYNVQAVNVGEAARDQRGEPLKDITGTREFFNLRSYMWWLLRDALNPDNPDAIGLPEDDQLLADLIAPKYDYTSRGQIKVESKDDIRARLKRSTDGADAVALALYSEANKAPKIVVSIRGYARDIPLRYYYDGGVHTHPPGEKPSKLFWDRD